MGSSLPKRCANKLHCIGVGRLLRRNDIKARYLERECCLLAEIGYQVLLKERIELLLCGVDNSCRESLGKSIDGKFRASRRRCEDTMQAGARCDSREEGQRAHNRDGGDDTHACQ